MGGGGGAGSGGGARARTQNGSPAGPGAGLPPTPAEVERFEADGYEKRVDELLASPRYGERWGRHLLDVWRYSDWYGYGLELRNSQKHI